MTRSIYINKNEQLFISFAKAQKRLDQLNFFFFVLFVIVRLD